MIGKVSAYHEELHLCAVRYEQMQHGNISSDDPLARFTSEFKRACLEGQPLLKLNRWVGYIQRETIERGLTSIDAERDWTRPMFRPKDFDENGVPNYVLILTEAEMRRLAAVVMAGSTNTSVDAVDQSLVRKIAGVRKQPPREQALNT